MEYPKRLTAINDTTGALIKSRGTNQDVYAAGWDAIFGKKSETDTTEVTEEEDEAWDTISDSQR